MHAKTPEPTAASLRAKAAKLERAGDLAGALEALDAAARLAPQDLQLLAALARLSEKLGLHKVAAAFWSRVSAVDAGNLPAVDGQARALRAMGCYDEAIGLLRETLLANPQQEPLWTSLGVTLTQKGQPEQALTFFDEAIRLDPRSSAALYNRGGASFDLGRLDEARADYAAAARAARRPESRAMIAFATATLQLASGEAAAGWDAYETRLDANFADAPRFETEGQRWTPAAKALGKRMLVLGEQGLGDEIMFASVLPDLASALGPDGRMAVAVDPRLVELFARSFPAAEIVPHTTDRSRGRPHRGAAAPAATRPIDLWAPIGSLPRQFRRSLADFPDHAGYLAADLIRIAAWRAWLGDGLPAVGLTWRSGDVTGDRRRLYPALDDWAPVLKTAGLRFVNLQYGDCADELEAMAGIAGAPILQAPGLDIRDDLDGLAALMSALDGVIAVSNATGALAGAVGANLALIGAPHSWTRLGAGHHPWYPRARSLVPAEVGAWGPVMLEAAAFARETALTRR